MSFSIYIFTMLQQLTKRFLFVLYFRVNILWTAGRKCLLEQEHINTVVYIYIKKGLWKSKEMSRFLKVTESWRAFPQGQQSPSRQVLFYFESLNYLLLRWRWQRIMLAFTDEQITLVCSGQPLRSQNFPVDKVKIPGQGNISGLQPIANIPRLEQYVKYLWDWHAKQSNKQSVDEVWLLLSWPTRQWQKCSWGRKIDVKKQNFRESSSACAQAKKKREPMATSPLINWPRLFHAVVGLWCRHVRWLGEKIFMELSHKPEKTRAGRGTGSPTEKSWWDFFFFFHVNITKH